MNDIRSTFQNAITTHFFSAQEQKELERLKKACCEFEALLVKQLVAEMRKSATEGLMGGNFQAKFYEDFLDDAIAKQITAGKGIGVSDLLYSRMKEVVLRRFSAQKLREAHASGVSGGGMSVEVNSSKEKTS